ncbi:hypothetical protein DUI87_25568 [Hirundo rustica rustica]|uniref:Membrane-spanning 4-domains subfamily A member 12 n=1 Tax=Hirundo rustica rustica TaxID=333673 RepID=A0A3M0JCT9_HIRRU|nr:hypothetical protein DUI87_25568 [Hirundo rustica rustica]
MYTAETLPKGKNRVMGTIQIMTGFLHIGFGIVLTTLTNVYTSVFVIGEIPFLGGVSFIISGCLSIGAEKSPTECALPGRPQVKGSQTMNVISAIFALLGIVAFIVDLNLNGLYRSSFNYYSYLVLLAGNGISIVLLIFTILEFCIAVATANFWCRATRLSSNEAMLIVPSATRVDLAVPPAELPQPPSYTEAMATTTVTDAGSVRIITEVIPATDPRAAQLASGSQAPAKTSFQTQGFRRAHPKVLGTIHIFTGIVHICFGIILTLSEHRNPSLPVASGVLFWLGVLVKTCCVVNVGVVLGTLVATGIHGTAITRNIPGCEKPKPFQVRPEWCLNMHGKILSNGLDSISVLLGLLEFCAAVAVLAFGYDTVRQHTYTQLVREAGIRGDPGNAGPPLPSSGGPPQFGRS